jgi:L-amino acid N-acyltransferase YncA
MSVIDIFNYYIENSIAAYPENKVDYALYDMLLNMARGYPDVAVKAEDGELIGFGFLHAYNPFPIFKRTAEISYFIKPEHTDKGIGSAMLEYFIQEARRMNIDSILASISSLNERSIKFHAKHDFMECGRFFRIGRKFSKDFDVVWMQREI